MDEQKKEEDTTAAAEPIVSPIQPERDLDQERDDRVIPVVKGVLSDLGEALPSGSDANTDYTTLLLKILKRSLDADLNLTTDNPYIFQLVLSAYGALSSVVLKAKTKENDNARFGRTVHELLVILIGANVPLGKDVKPAEQEEAMLACMPQIQAIFDREELTWLEVKYVMEGLFTSLKATEQLFSGNIDRSVNRMEAKILGIEDMGDLTMKALDKTLTADMAEIEARRNEA